MKGNKVNNMAKSLAERLAAKIERELGVVCDPKSFRRTYVGRWQKASGAWVWTMQTVGEKKSDIGSGTAASECVKNGARLSFGKYGEIYIEEEGEKHGNTGSEKG